ncbi:G-protein beta WD-40 repeats containing protein [Reticulomyxa filosa]|uniref:G-protein beta WD-40 repeats containing protein n=1 Tax=Reticulomyxa filosa TaxID=46433 RepID=X6NFW1_RETFI|nr:G-protein beta WD-40 repeats containing protein [Reticulomyxa filosa]|eukprot:ETO24783.1 G-protein beta WD-40 repeats containing protein [Reticulomyxa filosa]
MDLEDKADTSDVSTSFMILSFLPIQLSQSQCIAYKHEILLCGGLWNNECYSYHTLKDKYNFICSYPRDVIIGGHCVVKLEKDNPDDLTLLSFGGKNKHTLIMKYKSVWDDTNKNEIDKTKYYNQWLPLTNDRNQPICIGREQDNYFGLRAVIGGSNNNLLFITYYPRNIDVFDMNIFRYINHDILPIEDCCYIRDHCLTMRTNEKTSKLMLFCEKTGLSIEYDEINNSFQFHKKWVCTTIRSLRYYAFVYTNDVILFFGGCSAVGMFVVKTVHKYSIKENKWTKYECTLPISLCDCVGVLSEDNVYLHILGGFDGKKETSIHLKTNVNIWIKDETEREKEWIEEEEEKKEIETVKKEMDKIKQDLCIQKLKGNNSKYDMFELRDGTIQIYKTVKMFAENYTRQYLIHFGWADDLNIIITRYILVCFNLKLSFCSFIYLLRKYFKLQKELRVDFGIVNSVQFSSDGTKILLASKDKTVRLLSVELGTELQVLQGRSLWVNGAQFSPDGNTILSYSNDKTIRLWDINSGIEIKTFRGHSNWITSAQDKKMTKFSKKISDIQFSPNGKLLALAFNEIIEIWDVNLSRRMKKLKIGTDPVCKIQFSRDSQTLVSCLSNGSIQIWDIQSNQKLKTLQGHKNAVIDVKFLSDGQTIVSCSKDKTIRLWDVKLGIELQELKRYSDYLTSMDISSDNNIIIKLIINFCFEKKMFSEKDIKRGYV